MRIAKGYKTVISGTISDSVRKQAKDELEKKYVGQVIEGSPKNVVNIGFLLDVGDISGSIDGQGRQNVFSKLPGRYDLANDQQEHFFLNQGKDMEYLLSAAKNGTSIRIWKSNAPYSICGNNK